MEIHPSTTTAEKLCTNVAQSSKEHILHKIDQSLIPVAFRILFQIFILINFQGAAVVPICLPLCCAAPCVIM